MIIGAIVLLLFLLGFGSMIISHAHREIHIVPKRIQMGVGIFIILFTSFMVIYLGGYLVVRTMQGERALEVGTAPIKAFMARYAQKEEQNDLALYQTLKSLNSTLQQQATDSALSEKIALQVEMKKLQNEVKSLKDSVVKPIKSSSRNVRVKRLKYTPSSRRKSTLYVRKKRSTKAKPKKATNIIYDLVGYDPKKYTPDTEPVLHIVPVD